jgi:hypothetical protein
VEKTQQKDAFLQEVVGLRTGWKPSDSVRAIPRRPILCSRHASRHFSRCVSRQTSRQASRCGSLTFGGGGVQGLGVTPDGTVPNTFGGTFGESICSGGFSGLFGNPADPLTGLGAAAVGFVAASGVAAGRGASMAAAAAAAGGPVLNPLSPLGALGRGAKNGIIFFLSGFPMFVPSLSWQNDRFYS